MNSIVKHQLLEEAYWQDFCYKVKQVIAISCGLTVASAVKMVELSWSRYTIFDGINDVVHAQGNIKTVSGEVEEEIRCFSQLIKYQLIKLLDTNPYVINTYIFRGHEDW